jgi:hypothetical protein
MSVKPPIDWGKWDSLLGTMSDAKLAREVGCSTLTVLRRRQKKGIRSVRWQTIAAEVRREGQA